MGSPERYCLKILVRPKALSQKRGVPDPRTTLCEGILTIVCDAEAGGTAGALNGAGAVEAKDDDDDDDVPDLVESFEPDEGKDKEKEPAKDDKGLDDLN